MACVGGRRPRRRSVERDQTLATTFRGTTSVESKLAGMTDTADTEAEELQIYS